MTIELKWESADSLLVIYSGQVSGETAIQSFLEIGGDPRFDQLRAIIADATGIQHNIATDTDMEKMAAVSSALAKSNPNIRNAIIMSPDESAQALVSFYQFLAGTIEWEIEIFHSEQEARDWAQKND